MGRQNGATDMAEQSGQGSSAQLVTSVDQGALARQARLGFGPHQAQAVGDPLQHGTQGLLGVQVHGDHEQQDGFQVEFALAQGACSCLVQGLADGGKRHDPLQDIQAQLLAEFALWVNVAQGKEHEVVPPVGLSWLLNHDTEEPPQFANLPLTHVGLFERYCV